VTTVFPHCRHCCWTHPAHVEEHYNACGCDECPYDYRPTITLNIPSLSF
jgi:hypothetical protein